MLEGIWWASYATLWLLVLVESLVILALIRQIGLLHLRIQPVGARTTNLGPEIGTSLPILHAKDIFGNPVNIVDHKRSKLLLFISPTCSACEDLLPAVKTVKGDEEGKLDVILISSVQDSALNRSYVEKHKLNEIAYIISSAITEQYGVRASPYGLLVDAAGTVRAKGIVNQIEHLESLIEVLTTGYATMESYVGLTRSNGHAK